MKTWSMITVFAGALTLLIPGAYADEWNKKTTMTFTGPVEIPGQVLSAGTYVFKLADSQADRNIVQVFNKAEDHLYGTFLTIPDYRMRPTGKSVIMFEERAAGAPEAVKAWFYPGDLYGNEFVYPKVKATELAKNGKQSVPSMPEEMAANTKAPVKSMKDEGVQRLRQSQLRAERPTGEEVDVYQEFETRPSNQATTAAARPQNNASAQTGNNQNRDNDHRQMAMNTRPANELPQTASPLPGFALLGLIALGAGASMLALSRSGS